MKKYSIAAGTIALFAAALIPAFANGGNDCSNGTTGAYSTNYCDIENKSEVEVKNDNEAKIENNVTGKANTGGNTASLNTLGGEIHTGDATSQTTVATLANVNTTKIKGGLVGGSNEGANDTTGAFSDNRVDISNKQDVEVKNDNELKVKNNVDVTSDTGYNEADKNTGPAYIKTGDADSWTSVLTHGNDNLTKIKAGGHGDGGNEAVNEITGAFSTNYVDIKNRFDVDVKNDNDAYIKNYVDVASYTGDNSANKNTLGGEIHTGDADAGTEVNTEANINTTRVWSSLGGFSNFSENSITGAGSDQRTEVENKHDVDVDNWNDVYVKNHVDTVSDTGYNEADKNTAGGFIRSGVADMWQEVLTHVNDVLNVIR